MSFFVLLAAQSSCAQDMLAHPQWYLSAGFGFTTNQADNGPGLHARASPGGTVGNALFQATCPRTGMAEVGRKWPVHTDDDTQWITVALRGGFSDWQIDLLQYLPVFRMSRLTRMKSGQINLGLHYRAEIPSGRKALRVILDYGLLTGIYMTKPGSMDQNAISEFGLADLKSPAPSGWLGLEGRIGIRPGRNWPAMGFSLLPTWIFKPARIEVLTSDNSSFNPGTINFRPFEAMLWMEYSLSN
jgi:hypothetical protein